MTGAVCFVGAGPGAADLITLRGANRVGRADLVLYAPSVIDPGWLREHARGDAELVDLSRLGREDVTALYRRLSAQRQQAVRLCPGDPVMSAELRDERDLCARLGLDVEVVAGVSAASVAAASAGAGLTEPDGTDSVVFTGVDQAGTAIPDLHRIRDLAAHGTTMAVQLPAARAQELAEALAAGGVGADTPVVVAYKASWPDETVLRTTVGELAAEVKKHNLWRHSVFLVGGALRASRPRPAYGDPERPASPSHRWSHRSWKSTPCKEQAAAEPAAVAAPVPAEPAAAESGAEPVKAPRPSSKAQKPGRGTRRKPAARKS